MNREEYENALFDRAHEYISNGITLSELIESEHLETISIEHETILYAMEAWHAIVPCYDFLILTFDHYDDEIHKNISEYAIYSQHDRDGKILPNVINYNADYKLEYVGEETFDNMAAAIAYAFNNLHTLHENEVNDSTWKKYEIEYTKNGIQYVTAVYGETPKMGIEHANYWYAEEDKIHSIDKIISAEPIDYYPYTYEDAVRMAINNKVPAINAILQQDRMAEFDKLDLIKVITTEDPVMFISLDTACRDSLVDILNENLCDDISQLIMDWTEPGRDLTEEDAGRMLGDMEASGYTLPIGFTPKDFMEVYHDCEPEEEEDE